MSDLKDQKTDKGWGAALTEANKEVTTKLHELKEEWAVLSASYADGSRWVTKEASVETQFNLGQNTLDIEYNRNAYLMSGYNFDLNEKLNLN